MLGKRYLVVSKRGYARILFGKMLQQSGVSSNVLVLSYCFLYVIWSLSAINGSSFTQIDGCHNLIVIIY